MLQKINEAYIIVFKLNNYALRFCVAFPRWLLILKERRPEIYANFQL